MRNLNLTPRQTALAVVAIMSMSVAIQVGAAYHRNTGALHREDKPAIPPDAADKKREVFGDRGDAKGIVFVCDASGSMINKMPTLKDQLTKAFRSLKPTQSFDIIFFQDQNYDSFSKYDHKTGLVPATDEAKKSASKFLEGVTTTGSTDPVPGIAGAFKEKPDLIYLLTDGDFPDNDAVLKEFTTLNKDHKVRVNTIAFVGDGDNETAFLDLLKKIAKDSGGTFKLVKESEL